MTLRDYLLASPETFSDFAWAAEQRFREGEELLFVDRGVGAVYLFGLAAEMWLKMATARFLGLGPASQIDVLLGPARDWMHRHMPAIRCESYHSLLFWSEYLIRRRAISGSVMPRATAGDFRHHVINRLHDDWKIEMRYRMIPLADNQAWRVYNDAIWVRQNWDSLWR